MDPNALATAHLVPFLLNKTRKYTGSSQLFTETSEQGRKCQITVESATDGNRSRTGDSSYKRRGEQIESKNTEDAEDHLSEH